MVRESGALFVDGGALYQEQAGVRVNYIEGARSRDRSLRQSHDPWHRRRRAGALTESKAADPRALDLLSDRLGPTTDDNEQTG